MSPMHQRDRTCGFMAPWIDTCLSCCHDMKIQCNHDNSITCTGMMLNQQLSFWWLHLPVTTKQMRFRFRFIRFILNEAQCLALVKAKAFVFLMKVNVHLISQFLRKHKQMSALLVWGVQICTQPSESQTKCSCFCSLYRGVTWALKCDKMPVYQA